MDKYVPKIDDIAKAALNARTNELTDDGAYSNHRRNLIVSESNWDENICSNVISTLPFEIEEDLRQELIQTAKNTNYKSYYELNLSDLDDKDCLKRIVDKFKVFEEIQTYAFLKLNKGTNVWPHADPNRYVNIYIPLYPEGQDYQPLEIYYNNKIYGISKNTKKVYVWNTRILHAVINNCEYDRYNLQLSLYIPYQEFYEKYKDIINV
jgi:hypothetical protein|tara:strand:+ start:2288 stop:2911 length:624 start_codon:yes stop_codon:yes gene_type:complete